MRLGGANVVGCCWLASHTTMVERCLVPMLMRVGEGEARDEPAIQEIEGREELVGEEDVEGQEGFLDCGSSALEWICGVW